MSRKRRKGYYIDGTFVAADQSPHEPLRDEPADDDVPSRTARKNASAQLQDMGVQLLDLRPDLFAALPVPETLREAILEAKRLTSLRAQRRQSQFIGKLMRRLDPAALEAVRAALRAEHGQSARATQLLHRAERWRDALIEADERLEQWVAEFPGTDVERLRALIRQARSEAREAKPGEAARQGSAYRQIFAIVRSQLRSSAGD
jgi:ribosome-associated protein